MPGEKSLFEVFPTATQQDWEQMAGKEGAVNLYWEPEEGIRVPSLVSYNDLPPRPSPPLDSEGRRWSNIPRIAVKSATQANLKALKWLELGADGIWFELSDTTDPAVLLQNVHLAYCSLVVSTNSSSEILENFFKNAFFKPKDSKTIRGFVYGAKTGNQLRVSEVFPGLRTCTVPLSGSTTSQSIASALATGAKQLESGERPVSIVFAAGIGPHFIEEIGRLRTLRLLWYQVCRAYGINTGDCFIHARTIPFTGKAYEPNGNMIMETTAALAAALGGCNALTVEPTDTQDEVAARAAVNVSNLLREESYLHRVSDPIRGAGALELYIDQLSQKAWKEFQKMMQ